MCGRECNSLTVCSSLPLSSRINSNKQNRLDLNMTNLSFSCSSNFGFSKKTTETHSLSGYLVQSAQQYAMCTVQYNNFHNHGEYILTSESNYQFREKRRGCFHIRQTFPCGLFNLPIKFMYDST